MPHEPPPDIVLLGADWQPRALLRAQLIEEGFDVVATDTWLMMRRHLRVGSKPRLAIIDLQGLPDPSHVLSELRVLMKPDCVLVLTASGTMPATAIQDMGFRVLSRPIVIQAIVDAAAEVIRAAKAPRDLR
jgi:hypothetical protein